MTGIACLLIGAKLDLAISIYLHEPVSTGVISTPAEVAVHRQSSVAQQEMNDTNDARAALTTRVIPHMTFSDGSASSMTGPPPPMPHYLNAEGRAIKRFAVEGNAVCMCCI